MKPSEMALMYWPRSRPAGAGWNQVSAEDWISKALQENPVLEPVLVTWAEFQQSVSRYERDAK